MRVALLHPDFDPEIACGGFPLLELGVALVEAGHEVSIITSHRSKRKVVVENGVEIVRRWRPRTLRVLRRYEDRVEAAPGLGLEVWRSDAEIFHAFNPLDAFVAAAVERALSERPVVLSLTSTPTREHLVDRRYRLEMTLRSVRLAAAVTVTDAAAAESCRRYLLREPLQISGSADRNALDYAALYESVYSGGR